MTSLHFALNEKEQSRGRVFVSVPKRKNVEQDRRSAGALRLYFGRPSDIKWGTYCLGSLTKAYGLEQRWSLKHKISLTKHLS